MTSSTVDTIPGSAWSATPDGNIESINAAWREYLGFDDVSQMWLRALHPHDKRHFLDFWAALASSLQPAEVEVRLRRHDGLFRWFVVRVVPLCDAQGRVRRWYGQNTDVEDRKCAEITLAGEKSLLEMVATGDALPVILDALCSLVNDIAGSCVCSVLLVDVPCGVVRHAAGPTLPKGLARELDGQSFGEPHWGPCARALQHNQQIIVEDIAGGASYAEWSKICLKEGLRACWTTPIRSRAGQPLGAFAIYQRAPGGPAPIQLSLIERFTHVASIAVEHAHSESALKRSEAQLARAQRLSGTGSFSYRADTQQLNLSDETYRLCGFELHKPVAPKTLCARVHPDDEPLLRDMLATGDRQFDFECRLRMDSGAIRFVHVVADALRNASGKVFEWVGVVRDVTESKAREAALQKTRAELAHIARVATLGALTASIAHEVNQPLSGVLTNTRLLERIATTHPLNVDESVAAARRARRDAERAVNVTERLRKLFQKEQTHTQFDLNDALKDVLSLLSHELVQQARVEPRLELAERLPQVIGDRVQVQQVIVNLLLNAAEAMSLQSTPRLLHVRTATNKLNAIQLSVSDTGPGIAADAQPHLFEAFHTTKSKGLGIGLVVSRAIIDSHRGRLWVEPSERGATFCFTLPALDTSP